MRRTSAWQWVGDYLVEVFAGDRVDNAVWAELLKDIAARRTTMKGVLVLPGSAAPSATQRAKLTEVLGGAPIPAAILSTSMLVRTATTALNYFVHGRARAFAPDQLDAALDHLQMPPEERPRMLQTIAALQRDVAST
jgi:hypothetical protein